MGTNYFLIGETPDEIKRATDAFDADIRRHPTTESHYYRGDYGGSRDEEYRHIGKKSAAGWWCYDCNMTLCRGGIAEIHRGRTGMYEQCPLCGKKPRGDGFNPVLVELGFRDINTEVLHGVQGASSFSWALDPVSLQDYLRTQGEAMLVEDEYGREMSGPAFLAMLRLNCPVQFFHSVGLYFS